MKPSAIVNFLFYILLFSPTICGDELPFNLPLCCFNAETSQLSFADSQVLASNLNSDSHISNESKNQPKLYKIVIPYNSTLQILTLKSKRSSGNGKIKFPAENSFDHVEQGSEKILNSPSSLPLPTNWTEQLRQALHDGLSKFNNWTEPPGENSTLWKLLKVAPVEVIDPLTRSVSESQAKPDISQPKFSGIMVSTPKGVEIRTQASSASNFVNYPSVSESECDCPLIQRGDLVLAYWSVNNQLSDGEIEYQVYPLPHNVPTPPIFIPFIPDLLFKASPLDLTPGLSDHNYLDHEISQVPISRPPPQVNFNPGLKFVAHLNPPELDRSILVETPEGYTPGFLEWYRGVLNEQFRIPYFPLGPHPFPHPPPPTQPIFPNIINFDHPIPGPGPGQVFGLNSPEIPPSSLPGAMSIPGLTSGLEPLPPSHQPGPPFDQQQLFPGIANTQAQMQEISPGFDGGDAQQLPLTLPMSLPAPESPSPPLIFQHPKSIQEIISGNALALENDKQQIPVKRRVNRDCRNGPGSVTNLNMASGCRKPRDEAEQSTDMDTDKNLQKPLPYSNSRKKISYRSVEKIAREEKPIRTTTAAPTPAVHNTNSRESSYILNF